MTRCFIPKKCVCKGCIFLFECVLLWLCSINSKPYMKSNIISIRMASFFCLTMLNFINSTYTYFLAFCCQTICTQCRLRKKELLLSGSELKIQNETGLAECCKQTQPMLGPKLGNLGYDIEIVSFKSVCP